MFGLKPGAASGRGKARVLLVDDDEDSLLVVSHQLRELGALPTAVNSAHEALTALQRHDFDALIADLHLEDGDSTSVIWWALLNGLPAAVLTASPQQASDWLRDESISIIAKPATTRDLEGLLQRAGFVPAWLEGSVGWELGA